MQTPSTAQYKAAQLVIDDADRSIGRKGVARFRKAVGVDDAELKAIFPEIVEGAWDAAQELPAGEERDAEQIRGEAFLVSLFRATVNDLHKAEQVLRAYNKATPHQRAEADGYKTISRGGFVAARKGAPNNGVELRVSAQTFARIFS